MKIPSLAPTPLVLLVLLVLVAPFALAGCMGVGDGELNTEAPKLKVELSIDKAEYGIGSPVIATVKVTNTGDAPESLVMPSARTVNLMRHVEGADEPQSSPVAASDLEQPEFTRIDAGKSVERRLLLPLATNQAGSFELFCVYHSEADESLGAALPSGWVPYRVKDEVLVRRDGEGRILHTEAERIATEYFKRESAGVDSKFVLDQRTHMPMFWVTVRFAAPDTEGRGWRSCLVDAWVGVVKGELDDPIPHDGGR